MEIGIREIFGGLSVILTFLNCFYYLFLIFYRGIRPHLFTQIIWMVVLGVVAVAQFLAGAGPGAWNAASSFILIFLIVIVVFRQGDKDVTKSDWLMFLAGLTAIPLWILTNNPLYAVIWVTFIDAMAYGPSFRRFYNRPFDESWTLYFIANFRHVFSLMAMETYNLTNVLFPIFGLIMNVLLISMLLIRRKVLGRMP